MNLLKSLLPFLAGLLKFPLMSLRKYLSSSSFAGSLKSLTSELKSLLGSLLFFLCWGLLIPIYMNLLSTLKSLPPFSETFLMFLSFYLFASLFFVLYGTLMRALFGDGDGGRGRGRGGDGGGDGGCGD